MVVEMEANNQLPLYRYIPAVTQNFPYVHGYGMPLFGMRMFTQLQKKIIKVMSHGLLGISLTTKAHPFCCPVRAGYLLQL